MDIWIVWNREVIGAANYVIHIITVIVINYYMDWFFFEQWYLLLFITGTVKISLLL
ncbi:hypothetical protein BDC45DRAFT_512313 [Circinella umbellata]|nr:hypothetical protein BDC45DRAFT_512313 [Circinella umbellata]